MSNKFDRAINPNDGSRRRLRSEEHKPKKKYNKKKERRKNKNLDWTTRQ